MAVYQSGTMPIIRRKSRKLVEPEFLVDLVGEKKHIKRLKTYHSIPSKAETAVHHHISGNHKGYYEFDFFWYEVETNA